MTNGAARLWKCGRSIKQICAYTDRGEELKVNYKEDPEAVLLQYPNYADGVAVRVEWK
jgi:hypothetical protein